MDGRDATGDAYRLFVSLFLFLWLCFVFGSRRRKEGNCFAVYILQWYNSMRRDAFVKRNTLELQRRHVCTVKRTTNKSEGKSDMKNEKRGGKPLI